MIDDVLAVIKAISAVARCSAMVYSPDRMRFPFSLRYVAVAVCAVAAAKVCWNLSVLLALEMQGVLDPDSVVYLILGRGLLNGFSLYTMDFFEVQPPGIFLLTAFSLLLHGDERIALLIAVVGMAALPVSLGIFAWKESKTLDTLSRAFIIALAVSLGELITLYLERRAPGVETQTYGSFFASMFVLCIAWSSDPPTWKRILLSGFLLFCALGTKEPFLLTTVAAVLLLARAPRDLVRMYGLPLVAGGAIAAVVLFAMGVLFTYPASLGVTFASRVGGSVVDPLLLRGLHLNPLHVNLSGLYPEAPLLAYAIWALWAVVPLHKSGEKTIAASLLSLLASVAAYFVMDSAYVGVLSLLLPPDIVAANWAVLLPSIRVFCVVAPIFVGLCVYEWKQGILGSRLVAMAALSLTALAVGISTYSGNHFAFAIPIYYALVLLCIRSFCEHPDRWLAWVPVTLLGTITAFQYATDANHLAYLHGGMELSYERNRTRVAALDGLMDACGIERYYSGDNAFSMTRHSPWGPIPMDMDFLGADHPLKKTFSANIASSALIVRRDSAAFPPQADPQNYTTEAPACAKGFVPLEGFTVWFRNGSLPPTPDSSPRP